MSESYHVQGIVPPDDKYTAMLDIWNSCTKQDIEPPKEVVDFFDGEPPSIDGILVDLSNHACVDRYSADMRTGFDVDIESIPDHVKHLRFFVSY